MSELVKVDSNPALIGAAQRKQSPQPKWRSEGWWLCLAGEWRSGGKDCACYSCWRKRDEVSRRVLRCDGELLQRLAREGPVVLGVHATHKTNSMNVTGKITADVSDGDCKSGMWVETWAYSYNQWVGVPSLLQDVLSYGIQPDANFDSDNAISHDGACCGWTRLYGCGPTCVSRSVVQHD